MTNFIDNYTSSHEYLTLNSTQVTNDNDNKKMKNHRNHSHNA